MKPINSEVLDAIAKTPADGRILGLVNLVKSNYDPETGTGILFDNNGNLYIGCVSRIVESAFNEYFGGKLTPIEREAIEKMIPRIPTGMVIDDAGALKMPMDYARRFEDGIVQFVRQGEFWQSKPGYAWALYGHVLSVKK